MSERIKQDFLLLHCGGVEFRFEALDYAGQGRENRYQEPREAQLNNQASYTLIYPILHLAPVSNSLKDMRPYPQIDLSKTQTVRYAIDPT